MSETNDEMRKRAEQVVEAYTVDVLSGNAPGLTLTDLVEVEMRDAVEDATSDLLAVLKEIVERREARAKQYGGSQRLLDGSDGRYARARAAIAKAEGRAQ